MTHSIRESHVCASADRFERTLVVLLVHTFLFLQYYTLKINRPEDLKVQVHSSSSSNQKKTNESTAPTAEYTAQ